jgi:hypothetical protein
MQHELGRRVVQTAPRDSRVHSSWLYIAAPAAKALHINEFIVRTLLMASISEGQASVQSL